MTETKLPYDESQIRSAGHHIKIAPNLIRAALDPEEFMRELGNESRGASLGMMICLAPDDETTAAVVARFNEKASADLDGNPGHDTFVKLASYAPDGGEAQDMIFRRWLETAEGMIVPMIQVCRYAPLGSRWRKEASERLAALIAELTAEGAWYGIEDALSQMPNTSAEYATLLRVAISHAEKLLTEASGIGDGKVAYGILMSAVHDGGLLAQRSAALQRCAELAASFADLEWVRDQDKFRSRATRMVILKALSLEK